MPMPKNAQFPVSGLCPVTSPVPLGDWSADGTFFSQQWGVESNGNELENQMVTGMIYLFKGFSVPKIRDPFLGVPTMGIIVHWGL